MYNRRGKQTKNPMSSSISCFFITKSAKKKKLSSSYTLISKHFNQTKGASNEFHISHKETERTRRNRNADWRRETRTIITAKSGLIFLETIPNEDFQREKHYKKSLRTQSDGVSTPWIQTLNQTKIIHQRFSLYYFKISDRR